MIEVVEFDSRPLRLGESGLLRLEGDSPFYIDLRCFIDEPRPPGPGFLPCEECARNPRVVTSEPYYFRHPISPEIAQNTPLRLLQGHIELFIRDSIGTSLLLRVELLGELG